MPITVRYYAGARAAAGRAEETLPADQTSGAEESFPAAGGLDDLIALSRAATARGWRRC